jgi:hypothetical protein
MNRAALSIFVWGIYVIGVGLGFLLVPNVILPLFGLPTTTEVWIHLTGLLAAILGIYHIVCARNNLVPYFRATIPGRFAFAAGIGAFVLLDMAGPALLLFGFLDIVGGMWTWWALRNSS